MQDLNHYRERIAHLLDELATTEGAQTTQVPGVQVGRVSHSAPRVPMVYRPHIIIVGQGRKKAYLGGQVYTYDPSNYLVLAVPIPAECEAELAPGKPFLVLGIDIDTTVVGEMLLEMGEAATTPAQTPRGISSTPVTADLGEAILRLLECLKKPVDSRVLGRQMVREVIYRVLQSDPAGALGAIASRDEHFTRITRVLEYIHTDYAKPIGVEDLAKRAGMSVSVFHHHFKLVTATSPLQYLKRIRLDRAATLMAFDGFSASSAAQAIGYEAHPSSAASSNGSSARLHWNMPKRLGSSSGLNEPRANVTLDGVPLVALVHLAFQFVPPLRGRVQTEHWGIARSSS